MSLEIRSEMVKFPFVAAPKMPIEDALIYMKECSIRHLPVVDKHGLVGVISERDILSYRGLNKADELTVGEIMCRKPYVVSEFEPLSQVVGEMARQKYGSVLVVNDDNLLVGIFTTIDALLLLEKLLNGESSFYRENENEYSVKDAFNWM